MQKLLLGFIGVCLIGMPTVAFADSTSASRSRDAQRSALMAILDAPHPWVSAEKLARIGADVQALLIEVVTAKTGSAAMRLRALGWLQYYPNSASKAVLLETIATPSSPEALRVALSAFASGFGALALPQLQHHLLHKDVLIREASALALGHIDDRRVRPLLESQLEREISLAVRDAMMTSLQRIATRERAATSGR
ncbi:MAG: hypothetical protein EXR77_11020 [Myxococcales bacterium]|nr:hypothetical protein [Myxococcales bacterium]